jgi:predicted CopG family antitoxin
LEAYERLRRVKRPDESFSEAIKRVTGQSFDLDEWLRTIREHPLSEEAVTAIEHQITCNERHFGAIPGLRVISY